MRVNRAACVAVLAFLLFIARSQAQQLVALDSFKGTNGALPYAGLTLSADGVLYGVTSQGGADPGASGFGTGTIFKLTTNGTLITLVSFDHLVDGYWPNGLTLGNDGSFYGTTAGGGIADAGTVFRATIDGTLTTLRSFSITNGANPYSRLTLGSDGNFYGTTYNGGSNDLGSIFKVTTNGTITSLVSFTGANGSHPWAALTSVDTGDLFGTTYDGGAGGFGTVYRLKTNGTTLMDVRSFTSVNGANPYGELTPGLDGFLYGATGLGGSANVGTVFRLTTNNIITTLSSLNHTNGEFPVTALTFGLDGDLYSTTQEGGTSDLGTIFRMSTNGTLTTVASFSGTNGSYPTAWLTLGSDGNFYGTAVNGGTADLGVVFRLRMPWAIRPVISGAAILPGGQFRLQFDSASGNYGVQASTNLANTNGWITIGAGTELTPGHFEFIDTNAPANPMRFYRLRSP